MRARVFKVCYHFRRSGVTVFAMISTLSNKDFCQQILTETDAS